MKKNSESLLNNYMFNTLYTLLNILFPIITASYVSRVLLADGVGKISFANNIVSYFLVFAQLGIPRYGSREIAKRRDQEEERNKIFWEIFGINFFSTLVMIILYYVMVINIPYFSNNRILMYLMGLLLIFNFLNVDWFYTGMEEYKYIALRSMFIKTVSVGLMFCFVKDTNDFMVYGLIQCCATGGNYIFNIINLRKYITFPNLKMDFKKHIKSIMILLSMTIAVELYAQ